MQDTKFTSSASPERIFDDEEFEAVGAELVPTAHG